MKLIKLTQYVRNPGGLVVEVPTLLNPEGIGVAQEGELESDDIPIIGENSHKPKVTLMTLRNMQKIAVKDTIEDIIRLCLAHHELPMEAMSDADIAKAMRDEAGN